PPRRPALSWAVKIKKKLKPVAPFLGKFRPTVGQCCHQCAPRSLGWKLLKTSPSLGFQDLLAVNETHTRYRGWLVRRVCCVLFVGGRRVYPSPASDRADRVCSSARVQRAAAAGRFEQRGPQHLALTTRGRAAHVLPVIDTCISPILLRVCSWVLLRLLGSVFCSVQVNLSQLAALHKASEMEAPLVFVSVQQCGLDYALLPLVLLCHNLRVPYTICPPLDGWLRSVLQRLGVILRPGSSGTEQDPEEDRLYGPLMTSGRGLAFLQYVLSLLRGGQRGSVRIHFAQAFSLKEMCDTGRCRVDGARPLQELLLPAILKNRSDAVYGQKSVSWVLAPPHCPELPHPERQFCTALVQHLLHSTTSCAAVMSTGLVSCLLLHKHRRGVRLSELCRDSSWLLEEVLFRNRDVGFGGSLWSVVHHALSLLRPSLVMAQLPPGREPLIAPRPCPAALLSLARHCDILTHAFILEAVGACAVSSMLSEVAHCGGGGGGEMEFDVALCQEELTEKALQLCYLLPLGHHPPCQSPLSFALDAVDSLVRCGILVMEELPRDRPVCDFLRTQGTLRWSATDEQDHSDSDCEEQDTRRYRLSQPSQCPDLLLFLCSMLSVQLRALSWAIEGLQTIRTPVPESECVSQVHARLCDRARQDRQRFESSSVEVAREAVRTLTDLGVSETHGNTTVLEEVVEKDSIALGISPLFQQAANRDKLHKFICQFLCS
ncbi:glycerol-3-phosphate acyltransferase 2, mitochondrial, partial [Conger conger]|uniref:glycerol-3-phosphate acyltransferase 2, mitochondrial n=1 Tax=Conger conger TaxID=82655 RepID=UPI002A5A173A